MSQAHNNRQKSLIEVRRAREEAEFLRNILSAEYQRLRDEQPDPDSPPLPNHRRQQGLEAIRKAIAAADRAVDSVDQALREMERVKDDPELHNC